MLKCCVAFSCDKLEIVSITRLVNIKRGAANLVFGSESPKLHVMGRDGESGDATANG